MAAVTTAAVFGVVVWWMFHVVSQAGVLERQVRDAEAARSAVVRAQLDEETGVRGYVSTGRRLFLQPYADGRRDFAPALERQKEALRALGERIAPGTRESSDAEAALNARWQREVAVPLIAAPHRRDAGAIQLAGKQLVDAFRDENDKLVVALLGSASAADVALQAALGQIVLFGVLGALALIVVVRLVTNTGERLRRDAVRQRVLYEDEKRIADTLQQAFVQRTLPDVASVVMHAVYIPAGRQAQVGGDWYEAMQLPDGRIFVSVGDVSGHGVEAAVAMTRARQTLTTLATLGRSPSEILEHVNQTLIVQGQAMVTAVCCFIDPQTLEIEYACAGHPPAVIVEPNGGAHFVAPHGIPLGVVDHASYTSYLLSPPAGSLIVLYTDGLVEYDHDLIAGERRLLMAVDQVASSGAPDPAGALRDAIFGKRAPVDDVAVVTLRMGGPQLGRPAEGATRERMGHARKTRTGGRR